MNEKVFILTALYVIEFFFSEKEYFVQYMYKKSPWNIFIGMYWNIRIIFPINLFFIIGYIICQFTVVDMIKGDFGVFGQKKLLRRLIFIWLKRARHKISCDVVHFFIDLVIIEIFFDLYFSDGRDSIATHTLTNNRKLFNQWITWKQNEQ